MGRSGFLLACTLVLVFFASTTSADIVERSFFVKNLTITRLCKPQVITAVNGKFPGPTIHVREGDTLIVHVINQSPYNLTIHWHGVFQKLSCWADGPSMVTQCPIRPGKKYTYKFTITDQEGTLFWHAHISWLRATVHGALVIRPRSGKPYPFPKPYREVPIILGEWWNANVVDVENQAIATGGGANASDALTINGWPGDLYPCSQNHTYTLNVKSGKTYLLRIVNAALNAQLFYKIANHNLIVVAVDASYTNPYVTDVIPIAPGQTVDALLIADQNVGSYYMATNVYESAVGVTFDNTTARGVVVYDGATYGTTSYVTPPLMPVLPAYNDTPTFHKFFDSLTGLKGGPHWVNVPETVDHEMFVTVGMGLELCPPNKTCAGPMNQRLAASMNNQSLVLPTRFSVLEAYFHRLRGVYNSDFPANPPIRFDYTNASSIPLVLFFPPKTTEVTKLKFNSTVEMIMQNTAILTTENHPMHIHGFSFHVLAQGFGNFNPAIDRKKFNLVDPQMRNTVGLPVGGWVAIRFTANNPGVWFMHCHLEVHVDWGMATVFVVENGPTPDTRLPPPPADLPKC